MNFCLGIINADTESAEGGRCSSFCASPFSSRLLFVPPKISQNWTEDRRELELLKLEMIRTFPLKEIRTTKQAEIREYFENLQLSALNAKEQIMRMNRRIRKCSCYYIVLFANSVWDLNVLRGIIFPPGTDFHTIGAESDLVELQAGNVRFRDFLRLSGFHSVRSAGLCCLSAKKLEGEEVYQIKDSEIPEDWNSYSENQKAYMNNDILVMDESLKIILNRKENSSIRTMNDLPLTATGFMRWRMMNNKDLTFFDGYDHDVSYIINKSRWQVMRRNLAYLMRSYKGGYCGPNPRIQYKILRNERCYDAKSMYPHKMLFFQMMQCIKGEEVQTVDLRQDREILAAILGVIRYAKSSRAFDDHMIFREKLEETLPAFIATLDLKLEARALSGSGIRMMPFLSTHKTEGISYDRNVYRSNGKIISADSVRVILSSVDLFLTCLCYRVTLLDCTEFLRMQWLPMTFVQKRPVIADFRRKELFSRIKEMNRASEEVRAYWEEEAGFSYYAILRMTDEEYDTFCKEYYSMVKAAVNGEYGLTVQKPLNDDIIVLQDEDGLYRYKTKKTVREKIDELIKDPELAPNRVKVSDYAAGCSITMWARWQLVTMMYSFYHNGIEVHYCDTDSLFVENTLKAEKLIELYNKRLKELYYKTAISKEEIVTIDDLGGIGEFEEDKNCLVWRTLGAKNYGYIRTDGKIKLTVAGLNTGRMAKAIASESDRCGSLEKAFEKYFRPNVLIAPSVANKLIMDRSGCRFDDGNWIGPQLVPCGFDLVSMDSTFHLHNARVAAHLQGEMSTYWMGMFSDRIYLEEKGFMDKRPDELKGRLYQQIEMILDDRQPIKGGYHYGKERV